MLAFQSWGHSGFFRVQAWNGLRSEVLFGTLGSDSTKSPTCGVSEVGTQAGRWGKNTDSEVS